MQIAAVKVAGAPLRRRMPAAGRNLIRHAAINRLVLNVLNVHKCVDLLTTPAGLARRPGQVSLYESSERLSIFFSPASAPAAAFRQQPRVRGIESARDESSARADFTVSPGRRSEEGG
ncbi:hypothetical protein EVAR_94718_1 [Eumeta japonica]|uniref:Uncharacterized protein n=1 Tax=Eumeta variegata TaxID=151549 RepID=A0A4C1UVS6_EUMVA|nr:hypothetical protein EVAR_94718_1 [Eumeta japonica]